VYAEVAEGKIRMGCRRRPTAMSMGAPATDRRHPFYRPVDRVDARLRLLLATVAALMLVLTAGAGLLVYDAGNARAADQQARTHPVTAAFTPDTDTRGTGTPVRPAARLDARTAPVLVAATWQWAGDARTGLIELPAGASTQSQIGILVDSSGNWTGPEITGTEIAGHTGAAVIGALVMAAALTTGLHTCCARVLDRHRQRYWDDALHRLFVTDGM
jgi:hypothetical protein